jgi:hypothetical protein
MARRTRRAGGEQLRLFEPEEPAKEQRGYTYEHVPDGRARRYRPERWPDELAAYGVEGEADDELAG